ncbi:MAG: hypothetical protein QOF76_5460 [Solirubrobacteraceae bacterium]|jgi:uncharacterized membrane protein YkoI|nr:hypothetical protein [Solirubrobacteraceae bacterium]
MQRIKKITAGVAALAALAFGGAQIAGATGGSDTPEANDTPDQALTGSGAQAASAAAVKAVGGGTAKSVEASDEGGTAVYEVKVDKGGTITEVTLDKSGTVLKQVADDDQGDAADTGDGDGENPDD